MGSSNGVAMADSVQEEETLPTLRGTLLYMQLQTLISHDIYSRWGIVITSTRSSRLMPFHQASSIFLHPMDIW